MSPEADSTPLRADLVVSVVSHGQGRLIERLLEDLRAHVRMPFHLVLTINIPEDWHPVEDLPWPVTVIRNTGPKGFAANHNAASRVVDAPFFCVLNPDVELIEDPFPVLVAALVNTRQIGVAAPLVVDRDLEIQDSARAWPTPWSLMRRIWRVAPPVSRPDWVAGMMMVFRMDVFRKIGGFDERYRLYYEDVELCCRLHLSGYSIDQIKTVRVIHEAQRSSHKNPRYFLWHVRSILRFFSSSRAWRCWLGRSEGA